MAKKICIWLVENYNDKYDQNHGENSDENYVENYDEKYDEQTWAKPGDALQTPL